MNFQLNLVRSMKIMQTRALGRSVWAHLAPPRVTQHEASPLPGTDC